MFTENYTDITILLDRSGSMASIACQTVDGFEAFVYPDQLPGMTVELIQPHAHSWTFPADR